MFHVEQRFHSGRAVAWSQGQSSGCGARCCRGQAEAVPGGQAAWERSGRRGGDATGHGAVRRRRGKAHRRSTATELTLRAVKIAAVSERGKAIPRSGSDPSPRRYRRADARGGGAARRCPGQRLLLQDRPAAVSCRRSVRPGAADPGRRDGGGIFIDLKMAGDISNTISDSVERASELGVRFITLAESRDDVFTRHSLAAGRRARGGETFPQF